MVVGSSTRENPLWKVMLTKFLRLLLVRTLWMLSTWTLVKPLVLSPTAFC